MHTQPDDDHGSGSCQAHALAAITAAMLAMWSLVGWVTGMPMMTSFGTGRPSLSVMTALAMLVGAGASLVLPTRPLLAARLGALEAATGVGVLVAHQLGITSQGSIPLSAWASPLTGLMFVGSGISMVLLATERVTAGQVVAAGVFLFTLLLALGHLDTSARLYHYLPGTGVAIPTVLAFAALSLSQLLARRHAGIASALSSQAAAGNLGLKLLLTGLALLGLLSVVSLLAFRQGLVDAETALLLLTWFALGTLGATLWALAVASDRFDMAKRKAEAERDQIQRTVAAAIAHDLRNPLHISMLSASVLAHVIHDPQQRKAIERLQHGHRRLEQLLRTMLDTLAIASGGRIPFDASECDMQDIIGEVVSDHGMQLEDRVVLEGRAHGWWDRSSLYRVFENLLLNASKYGAPGTPIVCQVNTQDPGSTVQVTVTNHGLPIPEAERDTIFRPFARGRGTELASKSGWGVGLAFCRLVAQEHRGSLDLKTSTPDATVFELQLPVDARR